MTLRKQLLLLSLLLLLLPWGGCQYLRGVDEALRQLQAQNLLEMGQSVVQQLVVSTNEVDYPNSPDNFFPLYTQPINNELLIDGYLDDWQSYNIQPQYFSTENNPLHVTLMASEYGNQVYLLLQVTDSYLRYFNPLTNDLFDADHITLSVIGDRTYYLYASAPGTVVARWRDESGRVREQYNIAGVWQETANGYQLELRLDKQLLNQGFAIEIVDYQPQMLTSLRLGQTTQDARGFFLTSISPRLQTLLRQLPLSSTTVKVFNKNQQLIASLEETPLLTSSKKMPWLLEWLYRRTLSARNLPTLSELQRNNQSLFQPDSQVIWYQENYRQFKPQTIARLVLPISQQRTLGYLVLEKTTDQLIYFTGSAFNRFFTYSLLTVLVIFFGLMLYASWLSWRILRLNRAATIAVDDSGQLATDFSQWPDRNRRDELGKLSRNYQQVLAQIQAYHRYLRNLASKLSHELRTPIAIVRSSLDNLSSDTTDQQREEYLQRAQEGITRLNNMLTAMSSVNRLEESLADAHFNEVDLLKLLNSLTNSYQAIYPHHQFKLSTQLSSASVILAEELWVQMLDKMIANAVSFSEAGEEITLCLGYDDACYVLSIENKGVLLPQTMTTQLFEPMVSMRDSINSQDAGNLGLGLYVVRLIADLHNAQVDIKNLPDDSGVKVTVKLPKGQK